MSLKTFHIVFILVTGIFSAGFAVWSFRDYRAQGDVGSLILAIGSLVGCVALVVYGRWFLNKLKGTSYL
ncbi:MAG: hypothetical protein AABZ47_06360 [Planctomycetota bacterium]